MATYTPYRLFTAYADPLARELGTIYQACNFYYLGQSSGTACRYISPYTGRLVSDRYFRCRSVYRRIARNEGIVWQDGWNVGDKIFWDNIPPSVLETLRRRSRELEASAIKIPALPKHKYAYVLGSNKAETKKLRMEFLQRNRVYPYPKDRSPDPALLASLQASLRSAMPISSDTTSFAADYEGI